MHLHPRSAFSLSHLFLVSLLLQECYDFFDLQCDGNARVGRTDFGLLCASQNLRYNYSTWQGNRQHPDISAELHVGVRQKICLYVSFVHLLSMIRRSHLFGSCCVTRASTGLRMPRLMGNWEHLLTRNRYADESVRLLREFQKDLENLSDRIDESNKSRSENGLFPMTSFDPVHLESSVSV